MRLRNMTARPKQGRDTLRLQREIAPIVRHIARIHDPIWTAQLAEYRGVGANRQSGDLVEGCS
jgi:hypothetical protein